MEHNEFLKVREEFLELSNKSDNIFIINKNLRNKKNLRRVFGAIIKKNPCRISDIIHHTGLGRQAAYKHIHELRYLKILNQISIIDIYTGKIENKSIKDDFEKWTEHMNKGQKRFFTAVTNYWELTEFGESFLPFVIKLMKEGDIKDGNIRTNS